MLSGEHVTAECCGEVSSDDVCWQASMSQLSVVVKCGVMLCVLTGEHVTAECCGEVWSDDVC